jgi:hypothetical protein
VAIWDTGAATGRVRGWACGLPGCVAGLGAWWEWDMDVWRCTALEGSVMGLGASDASSQ